jgi:2,3-bisphosphoglycerate-dependent phosphoglycerate mutase
MLLTDRSFNHETSKMPNSSLLLVLLRHGESEWNLKNLFTGWKDPDLTPKGIEEAEAAGQRLRARGLAFDLSFTSALIRAQHTLDLTLAELGQTGVPIVRDQALNERDYGDLSGLNKDEARGWRISPLAALMNGSVPPRPSRLHPTQ